MQDKHYLDDWIHVPICQKGDKLYHYTTAEGIRGIVENREFVATKSDFLNDKMEFQYAVEVMERLIERYIVNTDLRRQFSAKLKAEIDRIGIISSAHAALDEDEMSFYVVAFSKQNNNSLLWAEFTDFRGYCLEFDYEKIVEGFRHRVFLHGTVIYDEEEQMNGLLESLLSCIHSLVEKGAKDLQGFFEEDAIPSEESLNQLSVLIGEREEGELPLDKTQEIESLLLTKKDMINKQLGDLNLQKNFGCTVTRVRRSGIDLSPSPDLA